MKPELASRLGIRVGYPHHLSKGEQDNAQRQIIVRRYRRDRLYSLSGLYSCPKAAENRAPTTSAVTYTPYGSTEPSGYKPSGAIAFEVEEGLFLKTAGPAMAKKSNAATKEDPFDESSLDDLSDEDLSLLRGDGLPLPANARGENTRAVTGDKDFPKTASGDIGIDADIEDILNDPLLNDPLLTAEP